MKSVWEQLEQVRWSEAEKLDLTRRLCHSAKEAETMTKKPNKVYHFPRRLAIALAAALMLTACTAAVVLGPGLLGQFKADTPGAEATLNAAIQKVDRSLTYEGWTATLTEFVGDDVDLYFWLEVQAPEGKVLTMPEDGGFRVEFDIESPEGMEGGSGGLKSAMPQSDLENGQLLFCLDGGGSVFEGSYQGQTVDVVVQAVYDWRPSARKGLIPDYQGEQMEEIMGHQWVFEDVKLNCPDQTIRFEPNLTVPFAKGETTLTKIEISPLSTLIQLEDGSCWNHHDNLEKSDNLFNCSDAMEISLIMKDGSEILPGKYSSNGSFCMEGQSKFDKGQAMVHYRFRYDDFNFTPRIIDPAQVAFIRVCGVEVPVNG